MLDQTTGPSRACPSRTARHACELCVLNVSPRRRIQRLRLACWLVCGGEPSSSVGDDGYTGLGEITSGSTYTCGGVSEPCVPSCRRDIIGLSGGASVLNAGLHRATQSSISTLQPSASRILAKTKSALRKVRIPPSTTVGWPKLPLGTAGSGTVCTPYVNPVRASWRRIGAPQDRDQGNLRLPRPGKGSAMDQGDPDPAPILPGAAGAFHEWAEVMIRRSQHQAPIGA